MPVSESILNCEISDTQANRKPKTEYDELSLDVNSVKSASIPMRVEWRRHGGDWGDLSPPITKSRQKLSMKKGTKLVGYTVKPEIIHTHATFEVF